MNLRQRWSRDELIIAMNLYCKLPFGQLDHRTPLIIEVAQRLGRTPSSPYLENFLPDETLERNFVAYCGKPMRLPEKFQPNADFLRYHREELFIGA